MELHDIARHGSRYDIQSYFETLKLNSTLDTDEFQEYVISHINAKNEAKYSPLHCSIFARWVLLEYSDM